jgi:DNA-binding CsgD family transcriptional regulator
MMHHKKYLYQAIILTDSDWEKFKAQFELHYPEFYIRLHERLPLLTPSEIRLITLLKLQLSTKAMAAILGVSPQSIIKTRYRLKKKLNLSKDEKLESALQWI